MVGCCGVPMFIWPSRPGSWTLAWLIFYINEVNLIKNEIFDNTFGNQLKDIALANKFEEDKFARANRQADQQEEKYSTVWGALMGARNDEATAINLYDSDRQLWNNTFLNY